MLITCYSDIHNMLSMLDYPTTLRKTVAMGVDLNLRRFGRADVTLVGGDTVSDYVSYRESGWLPKRNFMDIKEKLSQELKRGTRDGRVIYIAGNHDFACGEGVKEGYNDVPYNSSDYYFTGPMREDMGTLPDADVCMGYSEKVGRSAGAYLLGFRYEVGGIDFYALNFHPDDIYSHQAMWKDSIRRYSPDALRWLKQRLRETDPDGHKPTVVLTHMPPDSVDCENRALLLDAYRGHRNIFHLFGDTHGIVRNGFTAQQVFRMFDRADAAPDFGSTQKTSRDWTDQSHLFTAHLMGTQRCDLAYLHDVVPGDPGTDEAAYQLHPRTATPRISQGLAIKTFPDRFEFRMCNHSVGLEDGRYATDDPIEPYIAYFR